MKTTACVLAGVLMLLSGAASVAAQNSTAGTGSSGASLFPPIPGLGSYDMGGMKVKAAARVGYQWIGLNFNLPTSDAIGIFDSAPIDIQLKDARVWVGSLGLEARVTPRFSIFANGEANAKIKAGVVTSETPLGTGFFAPYEWNASGIEWWAIEGAAAYSVSDGAAIFAGLRRDHLSFGMTNPRDQFGNPINEAISVPGIVLLTIANAADVQIKLWLPYVGLRVIGPNYRASVIWSPFANAAVKIPDRLVVNIFEFPPPSVTFLNGLEWRYSMFQTGALFEGQLEYDVNLGPNLFVNVWAKGSWLRVRGRGNLDEILNQFVRIGLVPPLEVFSSLQGNQSATGKLSRSLIAVGLTANMEF